MDDIQFGFLIYVVMLGLLLLTITVVQMFNWFKNRSLTISFKPIYDNIYYHKPDKTMRNRIEFINIYASYNLSNICKVKPGEQVTIYTNTSITSIPKNVSIITLPSKHILDLGFKVDLPKNIGFGEEIYAVLTNTSDEEQKLYINDLCLYNLLISTNPKINIKSN